MSEEKPVSTPPGGPGGKPPVSPTDKDSIVANWRAEKAERQKEQEKSAAPKPTAVSNIGPKQVMLRYGMGIGVLIASVALSVLLIRLDTPFMMRLVLFFP